MAKKYIVATIHGTNTRLQAIKKLEDEFVEGGEWFEGTAIMATSPEAAASIVAEDDAVDSYGDELDFRYVIIELGDMKVFKPVEAKVVVKEVV